MPCPKCTELERQLKEAWETILRMDTELKRISEILAQIEATNQAKCDVPQA